VQSSSSPVEYKRAGFDFSFSKNLVGVMATLVLAMCRLHAHGELEIRIAALSRQIATNSTDARLYLERGELHRLHQDWPAATADFDQAAQLDTNLTTVGLVRARLLADSGRAKDAGEAYNDYLKQVPRDGVALIERARIRARLDALEAAHADYTAAISFLPEPQPEYFIERAELSVRRGDRDQAISGLDEGLRRLGVIVTLQSRAMELELERKNYDEALRRLETIIGLAKRPELWLEKKGQILHMAGREPEAMAAFHRSLEAVGKLPLRLQTTPQMEGLKERVRHVMNELAETNRSAAPFVAPKEKAR
jgi:predicted Zn-dependent protease